MITLIYAPAFVRQFGKLDKNLQEEIIDKLDLLKNIDNHKLLKVHKLHGQLNGRYSFYINYKIRIIFNWNAEEEVFLLVIGDHDVYKK